MDTLATEHSSPSLILKAVRDLARHNQPLLEMLGFRPRIRLVLDSNILINELRFHLRKKKPEATTSLQEVLTSREMISYVPYRLVVEVESKFGELAAKFGVTEEVVRKLWEPYLPLLTFVPDEALEQRPGAMFPNLRDPNDLEFLQARSVVAASAVVSKDKDIYASGEPTITDIDVFFDLRNYVREKTIEIGIKFGSGFMLGLGAFAVLQLLKGLAALPALIARLPPWVRVALGGLVFIAMTNKDVREWLKYRAINLTDAVRKEGTAALQRFQLMAENSSAAGANARVNLARALARLPGTGHATITDVAFGACIFATTPLSSEELHAEAVALGCTIPQDGGLEYVAAALRLDDRITEVTPNHWICTDLPLL